MELDPALRTYVAEGRELLQDMEDALLSLEDEENKDELVSAIFRAAHTIKGSAGLFGLDDIVAFTHGLESLLDRVRDGELSIDEDMVALFLACRDHINNLIDHVEGGGGQLDAEILQNGELLSEKLRQAGAVVGASAVEHEQQPAVTSSHEKQSVEGAAAATDNWHISLRFGIDALRDGMDPLSFLRYLGTIGRIAHITTLDDHLPCVDEMDPESCYLGFEINFESEADKESIEGVFDFIRQDSVIRILPPRSRVDEYVELIHALPEEDMYLGEILVHCGSLTQGELQEALAIQDTFKQKENAQPIGNIVVEQGMTRQTVVDAAVDKQAKVRQDTGGATQSIRVDADKLDNLINLIGELVIAGAGAALEARASRCASSVEAVSMVTRLVEEVRDSALRLRMVQIGATFNRFKRVVRDVCTDMNKEIDLAICGAETELDKTVVEKIGDPLMHLVRNAIDHGIEAPDVRLAQGKPAGGTVCLNACHDSGSVVIEVSDDGGGLDREKILKKAIDKGLVNSDQHLTDSEIYNLIFEPGFSTSDQVSNLSGRGVGMDVVKRNITALRGTVDVDSQAGSGTTFRIRMPLTLAIIDGFLVGVENSSFVVPLDMVVECVELDDVSRSKGGARDYINLRGEVLPFIRLRDMFEVSGRAPRRESVVVVHHEGAKAGLVVDQLMGEFQTVIKPLGQMFNHVRGVGGSTILGTGEVALIIDVPGLVQQVSTNESIAVGSPA